MVHPFIISRDKFDLEMKNINSFVGQSKQRKKKKKEKKKGDDKKQKRILYCC
jgi:hypothetical protein